MSFVQPSAGEYELPSAQFTAAFQDGTYDTRHAEEYATSDCYEGARESNDHMRPVKAFEPGKIVYHVDLCFTLPRHCCADAPVDVNIHQNDLIRTWQHNGASHLLQSDLSRVVPTSIKIVGTTLPSQAPYALQLYDANGMSLFETHGANYSSGAECDCYGFPLFMDDKTIFRSNGVVDDHVRNYANVSIKDIKKDCLSLEYPGGLQYALVPKDKGWYFAWVLEVKERGTDSIMTNPAYQDANHPSYIRLYKKDFDRCITYYENALERIKFANLTKMKARLMPRDHYVSGHDPADVRQETVVLEVTARAADVEAQVAETRMAGMRITGGHAGKSKQHTSRMSYGQLQQKFGGAK